VLFLARILGLLYMRNNIDEATLRERCRSKLLPNTVLFLVFFLAFFVRLLVKDGYAYDAGTGVVSMVSGKYLSNLLTMWPLAIVLIIGVAALLYGILLTWMKADYARGIWPAGIGTVLVVLVLFLMAGWNNTAYYPSNADLQSSLTIANSCSSLFTLKTMFYVSLLIPFVLAYIAYCWHAMDHKKLTVEEVKDEESEAY